MLWGQIDFILDELLLHILNLTIDQRQTLIGEKPMGPKLDLMKPQIKKIVDSEIRGLIEIFYRLLNDTKAKRNHAFHGIWGWRAIDRGKKVQICSRHPKALHNPVRASDLPTLEAMLCEASHIGMDALAILRGWDLPEGVSRFSHGKGPAPEWYEQWLEQRLLGDHNLDRSWSAGELPRLIDPMK